MRIPSISHKWLVLLLLLTPLPVVSNSASDDIPCVSKGQNTPLTNDIVHLLKGNYAKVGESGNGILWDFSDISAEEDCTISYQLTPDSAILRITENGIGHYMFQGDSLLLSKLEDRNSILMFHRPVLVCHYPMTYGNRYASSFSGEGKFCNQYYIRQEGTVEVEADGCGTVILPSADTLRNVTRLCTITTKAIQLHVDSCTRDSDFHKHEIVEHYQWFSPERRFPVFESVVRTSYSDMQQVASYQESRWPDFNEAFVMEENQRNWQQYPSETKGQDEEDIFRYQIDTDGNRIAINYDLTEDCDVRILVAGVTGVLHKNTCFKCEAGEGQALSVDCNDLRPGQYIIYISVKGNTYNHKMKVR